MDAIIARVKKDGKLKTVPLDRNEVYYTNCSLILASNVDQELGWTKEIYRGSFPVSGLDPSDSQCARCHYLHS